MRHQATRRRNEPYEAGNRQSLHFAKLWTEGCRCLGTEIVVDKEGLWASPLSLQRGGQSRRAGSQLLLTSRVQLGARLGKRIRGWYLCLYGRRRLQTVWIVHFLMEEGRRCDALLFQKLLPCLRSSNSRPLDERCLGSLLDGSAWSTVWSGGHRLWPRRWADPSRSADSNGG